MRPFYRAVAAMFAAQGHFMTLAQVRKFVAEEFRLRCLPVIKRGGWPVPETEEGRVFAMSVLAEDRYYF